MDWPSHSRSELIKKVSYKYCRMIDTNDELKVLLMQGKDCKLSKADMLKVLKLMYRRRERRPLICKKFGLLLLDNYSHSLGDDYWFVCEQVFLACLDVHEIEMSKTYLEILSSKFTPESARVRRLRGLLREALAAASSTSRAAESHYKAAENIYTALIKENPANRMAHKRLVSILRAQNKIPAAIKKLNEYMKIFQSDADAWQELDSMYCDTGRYKLAKFCAEEYITFSPIDAERHTHYAELCYTAGQNDPTSLRTARRYFAQSLDIKPKKNYKSLVGILASSAALPLVRDGKKDTEDLKLNAKLHKWAGETLMEAYGMTERENGTGYVEEMAKYVESVIKKQNATFQNA